MRVFILSLCFLVLGSVPAFAQAPDCGQIPQSEIDHIFVKAEKIHEHYDVFSDLVAACEFVVELDEWEPRAGRDLYGDSIYLTQRSTGLWDLKRAMLSMDKPLFILNDWYAAESASKKPSSKVAKLAYAELKKQHALLNRGVQTVRKALEAVRDRHKSLPKFRD